MELLKRIQGLAFFIIIGIMLILVAGMVVVYLQQTSRQSELNGQIDQLSGTLANPAPDSSALKHQQDEVNQNLKIPPIETIIDTLLSIAEDSGIDTDPARGQFIIPAQILEQNSLVGAATYPMLAISNIQVAGSRDNVLGFVAALEEGSELPSLAIKAVVIRDLSSTSGAGSSGVDTQANLNVYIYYNSITE